MSVSEQAHRWEWEFGGLSALSLQDRINNLEKPREYSTQLDMILTSVCFGVEVICYENRPVVSVGMNRFSMRDFLAANMNAWSLRDGAERVWVYLHVANYPDLASEHCNHYACLVPVDGSSHDQGSHCALYVMH